MESRPVPQRGDQTAVESLRRVAERESEFDVQEMLAAMERKRGEQGRPMWMRIAKGRVVKFTNSRKKGKG